MVFARAQSVATGMCTLTARLCILPKIVTPLRLLSFPTHTPSHTSYGFPVACDLFCSYSRRCSTLPVDPRREDDSDHSACLPERLFRQRQGLASSGRRMIDKPEYTSLGELGEHVAIVNPLPVTASPNPDAKLVEYEYKTNELLVLLSFIAAWLALASCLLRP